MYVVSLSTLDSWRAAKRNSKDLYCPENFLSLPDHSS